MYVLDLCTQHSYLQVIVGKSCADLAWYQRLSCAWIFQVKNKYHDEEILPYGMMVIGLLVICRTLQMYLRKRLA